MADAYKLINLWLAGFSVRLLNSLAGLEPFPGGLNQLNGQLA